MAGDLNEALVFVKVVELGSLTAAGRALGLPKTTVSRRLQALEDRLGARLLNRTTRRIGLTEAGSVYFEHCQHLAQELDEAESAVLQLQSGPRGWLRVSAPYSLGLFGLAPLLPEFHQRYPDIRLDLRLDNALVDLIGEGLDLALRIGPLGDSGFHARRLAVFRSHVYGSPEYFARYGEPLAPEDIEHHRVLALSQTRRGARYVWSLTDGAVMREFELQPVMVSNDPFMLRGALVSGLGIGLTSLPVAREAIADGRLRRVLVPWHAPDIELNALYPGGRALTPKVRAFIDFLAERLSMRFTDQGIEH